MTHLYLIRHGQTEWNLAGRYQGQSDVPLSQKGLEQARSLAKFFPARQLDVIYSSDLQRAVSTAEAVAERFSLQVQTRRELRELNFGAWEGLSYEQIVKEWPDALRDFFAHPDVLHIPEGESFPALQARAVACIRSIVQENKGKSIAVFSHGAILRTILADALMTPLSNVWRFRQSNTAVNRIDYAEEGIPVVEYINNTAHLSKEETEV